MYSHKIIHIYIQNILQTILIVFRSTDILSHTITNRLHDMECFPVKNGHKMINQNRKEICE